MSSFYVVRLAADGVETSVGPFEDEAEANRVLDYVQDYANKHGFEDDTLFIINTGACDVG